MRRPARRFPPVPTSNDDSNLTPACPAADRILRVEFPGLAVGYAEYEEGPTGCTVFLFDRGWPTAIDKRGGLVGTVGDYEWCHALCFAGGSLLGLEAAAGVTAELWSRKDHSTDHIPLVNGAIIWDYGPRQNTIYPDKALGRAAVRTAQEGSLPIGTRGAGRSATVGKAAWQRGYAGEPAGQGAAYREFSGVKILVVTVLNAVGALVDRQGNLVRGNLNRSTGERKRTIDILAPGERGDTSVRPTQNTTLTLLLTDAKLSTRDLTQLGRQVHSSMARAIEPFHSLTDGDTLYAVTANRVETTVPADTLALVASEIAWDAVLSVVAD